MLSIFHHHQPDGSLIATCPTYPNWVTVTDGPKASRQTTEESLLAHIQATTSFAHYEVPLENINLRAAA